MCWRSTASCVENERGRARRGPCAGVTEGARGCDACDATAVLVTRTSQKRPSEGAGNCAPSPGVTRTRRTTAPAPRCRTEVRRGPARVPPAPTRAAPGGTTARRRGQRPLQGRGELRAQPRCGPHPAYKSPRHPGGRTATRRRLAGGAAGGGAPFTPAPNLRFSSECPDKTLTGLPRRARTDESPPTPQGGPGRTVRRERHGEPPPPPAPRPSGRPGTTGTTGGPTGTAPAQIASGADRRLALAGASRERRLPRPPRPRAGGSAPTARARNPCVYTGTRTADTVSGPPGPHPWWDDPAAPHERRSSRS